MPPCGSTASTLSSIRARYPEGVIPGADYPALLAVLRRYLPVDDVVSIARELIVRGTNPLAGIDLRGMLATGRLHILEADFDRISNLLQLGSPPADPDDPRPGS